jgi:hypothetical protein
MKFGVLRRRLDHLTRWWNVGRVLDAVEAMGELDATLVVYLGRRGPSGASDLGYVRHEMGPNVPGVSLGRKRQAVSRKAWQQECGREKRKAGPHDGPASESVEPAYPATLVPTTRPMASPASAVLSSPSDSPSDSMIAGSRGAHVPEAVEWTECR